MGIVEQPGNAEQGKLACEQFADSGLRNVKKLLKLAGGNLFLFDELEDVLMQIRLQLQLQTVLVGHFKLVKNASLCPVGDESGVFVLHAVVH